MRRAGLTLLAIAFGVLIGLFLANWWSVRGQGRPGSGDGMPSERSMPRRWYSACSSRLECCTANSPPSVLAWSALTEPVLISLVPSTRISGVLEKAIVSAVIGTMPLLAGPVASGGWIT